MNIVSEVKAAESLIGATVSKSATPWILLAIVLGLFTAGATGAYLGYQYGTGKAAEDKSKMLAAYNEALTQAELRRKDAESKGNQIVNDFVSRLDNLKVVNKTYNNNLKTETQKLVYTDCKLPDSGVDLLNKHINEANLILIGKKGATK
jgi:hypothetical protein